MGSIFWVRYASGNIFSIFIKTNWFLYLHWFQSRPHCFGLPYQHYQLVLSWHLQLSLKNLSQSLTHSLTHSVTCGPLDWTPGIPGSDRNTMLVFLDLAWHVRSKNTNTIVQMVFSDPMIKPPTLNNKGHNRWPQSVITNNQGMTYSQQQQRQQRQQRKGLVWIFVCSQLPSAAAIMSCFAL